MARNWAIRAVAAFFVLTLTGCSDMNDPKEKLGYAPATSTVADVRNETKKTSSEILNMLHLDGKVTEPGPRISACGDLDTNRFFIARHPWSLRGVPVEEMQEAMKRLKGELPRHDWKVVSYGPNSSKAKSLELFAESTKKKFAVKITLQDRRGRSEDPSMILVTVVSACYEVPAGQTVDEY